MGPFQRLSDINRTSFEQAFDLDVEAAVLLSAELLDLLIKAKRTIINMSSVGGSHAAQIISLYVAARAMKSKNQTVSQSQILHLLFRLYSTPAKSVCFNCSRPRAETRLYDSSNVRILQVVLMHLLYVPPPDLILPG